MPKKKRKKRVKITEETFEDDDDEEEKNKTKSPKKTKRKSQKKIDVEEALLHNFVNLQKVLTNLAIRFDDLSKNISKMLELFEISAKSFAENGPGRQGDVDKDFLKKLDSLLDQNKTISKGIMLMEERVRNKTMPSIEPKYGGFKRSPPRY
jgi:hypothetical protein